MANKSWMAVERRQVVALANAGGATLSAARREVWIAEERDSHGVRLQTGATRTVERRGSTLVETRADAALAVVTGAAATACLCEGGGRFWREVARRLAALARRWPRPRQTPYY